MDMKVRSAIAMPNGLELVPAIRLDDVDAPAALAALLDWCAAHRSEGSGLWWVRDRSAATDKHWVGCAVLWPRTSDRPRAAALWMADSGRARLFMVDVLRALRSTVVVASDEPVQPTSMRAAWLMSCISLDELSRIPEDAAIAPDWAGGPAGPMRGAASAGTGGEDAPRRRGYEQSAPASPWPSHRSLARAA